MSVKQATINTLGQGKAHDAPATNAESKQAGLALRLARVVWWLVVPLTVLIFLYSLPARYSQLQSLAPVSRSSADILRAVDMNLVRASLQELNLSAQFYATYNVILESVFALIFFIIALVIYRRKSADGVGLFVSLTLILFGTASIPTMAALAWVDQGWNIPLRFLNMAAWVMLLAFFYIFPDGKFTPRWTQPLVIAFGVWSLAYTIWRDAFFSPWIWPAWLAILVFAAWFVGGMVAEVYAYRTVYTPAQRKQTKWVMYGMIITVSGALLLALPNILYKSGALAEHPGPLYELLRLPIQYGLVLILPISILIAIMRANLFSIDLIINRTLVYVPLTAILAGLYSASITLFQRVFMAVTGERSDAAVVITTLILASTFTPMKSGLQNLVDRLFKEVPDTTKRLRALAACIEDDLAVLDKGKVTQKLLQEAVKGLGATGGVLYLANGAVGPDSRHEPGYSYGEWTEGRTPVWLDLPLERKDGTVIGLVRLGPRMDDDPDDRKGGERYTEKEREALKEVSRVVADAVGA